MKHQPFFVAKTTSGVCRIEPTTILDSPLKGEEKEELYRQPEGLLNDVLYGEEERMRTSSRLINKIVYDNVLTSTPSNGGPKNMISKRSSRKSKKKQSSVPIINFDSRFESGNLRRAIQVFDYEYDLILSYDTNSRGHTQWFYFSVDNVQTGVKYKFNILNFLKGDSLFNYGMKPCVYSEYQAKKTNKGWHRHGFFDIIYYQNTIRRRKKDCYFYTLTFSITFPHASKYYFSFSYPYSYTRLCKYLYKLEQIPERRKYIKKRCLCKTLAGNNCYVLTITNFPKTNGKIKKKRRRKGGSLPRPNYRGGGISIKKKKKKSHGTIFNNSIESTHHHHHLNHPASAFKRPTESHLRRNSSHKPIRMMKKKGIVLTARVHPGEAPSSFIMKGIIDFLTSKRLDAKILREHFIFKIVPMLNPDGVIVGNYRCSLAGVDLNRKWKKPSKKLHPTIFWTKNMVKKLLKDRDVLLFCDIHSHSRHKNVFMFGCDMGNGSLKTRVFPRVLNRVCKNFSFQDCSFEIKRRKKNTGRVVMFKELGIDCSYTLEASFCGSNFGKFHSHHFTQKDYEKLGHTFCMGLVELFDPDQRVVKEIQEELMILYSAVDNSMFSLFGSGEGVEKKDGFLYKKRKKKKKRKNKDKGSSSKKKKKKKYIPSSYVFHPIEESIEHSDDTDGGDGGGIPLVSRFPKIRFDD